MPEPTDLLWLVCHTKPRCEKKFAALMQAEKLEHYLALTQSVRRYGTQTKRFTKPLFPGYVFAQVPAERKTRIYQQDLLVRAITVEDVPKFLRQLEDVKAIVASGFPMCDRAWFRHEVDRLDRARRRARRVGESRLEIPGTAPDAVESIVEYFGLRAVASALASVAATDDPLRHPASIGPLIPQRVRSAVSATHVSDNRGLTARERAAKRGFYVA